VRILADVNDVDPLDGNEPTHHDELPTVQLVADWFVPRVTAQLCLDEGHGRLQWLTDNDIASWGVSQAELFSSAIDNLNAKIPSATLNRIKADGGEVYTPICEGVTLSSLILADKLLSDFKFTKDNIAAIIPNRDTYYFCDRASQESLHLLKRVGDIAWDDEDCPRKYRITKSVLVSDELAAFGWVPFEQSH
jgi:hypothetical protein